MNTRFFKKFAFLAGFFILISVAQNASAAGPTVTSITPNSMTQGSVPLGGVTIGGTNFISSPIVSFYDSNGNRYDLSPLTIFGNTSINISAGSLSLKNLPAGVYEVHVWAGSFQSNEVNILFTINGAKNPVPTLTNVTPASGPSGISTSITLTGTGFIQGVSQVSFNGTMLSATVTSPTTMNAVISSATLAGSYIVQAYNSIPGGGFSNNNTPNFTVINNGPGTLLINKITTGGDGKFAYIFSGPQNSSTDLQTTGGMGNSGSGTPLTAGTYSIAESMPNGNWSMSYGLCWEQDGINTGARLGNSMTGVIVKPGQTTICEFSNLYTGAAPTLEIRKILTPYNDSGVFNLLIDGQVKVFNVGNNGTTGQIVLTPGTHTISETAGTGTSLSNYSQFITGDCSPGGSVTLANGDSKICYINNTKISTSTANITLTKTTNSTAGSFTFTLTRGSTNPGNITLNPTSLSSWQASTTINGVIPGTYDLNEVNMPSGFSLGSASCSKGTRSGNSIINMNIVGGDNITCTFTDNYTPPVTTTASLKLFKIVSGNTSASAGSFTLSASGSSSFSDNGVNGTFHTVNAGIYTLSESSSYSGYNASWSCPGATMTGANQVTLTAGQTITCTVTNLFTGPALAPSISSTIPTSTPVSSSPILFTVVGANFVQGATIILTLNGVPITYSSNFTDSGHIYISSYIPSASGTYTVTVRNPDGQVSNSVNFIVSSPSGATITLKKITNGVGGTFTFINNFNKTIPSLTPASPNGYNDSTVITGVAAGNAYYISETNLPAGFTPSSGSCTGATANGTFSATSTVAQITGINVKNGDNVVCTFTNNATKLKLTKVVSGGTALASAWTLTATGSGAPITYSQGGGNDQAVAPGNYTLSESGPSGYSASGWNCTGQSVQNGAQITINANAAVSCTITNTYTPSNALPTIKVNKVIIPSSDTGRFNLKINGGVFGNSSSAAGTGLNVGNGGTTGAITAPPGTYTVAESANTSTSTTNINDYISVISGDCAADGTISVIAGDNKVCTITNTRKGTIPQTGTLRIIKNVTGSVGIPIFNFVIGSLSGGTGASSSIPTSGGTPNTGSATVTLMAGQYQVLENATGGFSPVSSSCDNGTPSSTTITAGQTTTCTFTNANNAPPTLVIRKSINPTNDSGKFNLQIDGATAGTGSNVGNNGNTGVVQTTVGTHTVSETAGTGTLMSDYSNLIGQDCGSDGKVTLAAGENKICMITNTRLVQNPLPVITTISPTTKNQCDGVNTLTVNGSGFIPTSKIYFDSLSVTTTYVSSTRLTADISSATEGGYAITVVNPLPGGGTSNAAEFNVDPAGSSSSNAPTISKIAPKSADESSEGDPDFTILVTGTNFTASSVVNFNNFAESTIFISTTQLSATIPAAAIANAGTYGVTVTNPSTDTTGTCLSQTSNSLTFTVNSTSSGGNGEPGKDDNNASFILPPEPENN